MDVSTEHLRDLQEPSRRIGGEELSKDFQDSNDHELK
jgi:hypothetical protein